MKYLRASRRGWGGTLLWISLDMVVDELVFREARNVCMDISCFIIPSLRMRLPSERPPYMHDP